MVKRGYIHNTGIFGDDAENYVSQLFNMGNTTKGTRRPDLVSVNGRFNPRLSIEVKSGIGGKVSIVASQLHYALNLSSDYFKYPADRTDFLKGLDTLSYVQGNYAYYYNLVSRDNSLKSGDVGMPHHSIRLSWQNQVLVPADMVAWGFAIARKIRTKERLEDVVYRLVEKMKNDFLSKSTNYKNRDVQDWQNFYQRDMMALFNKKIGEATTGGKVRNDFLKRVHERYDELERIEIPGPNDTKIFVLAHPEHYDLFDSQLRNTVEERKEMIERVHRSRRRCIKYLDQITLVDASGKLFKEDKSIGEKITDYGNLTRREVQRIKRVSVWADRGQPFKIEPEIKAVEPGYSPVFDGCTDEIEEGPGHVPENVDMENIPI